jgi:hypothetical protein
MERKALVIFILLLSSLVVLALLHYNQQALAPVPSPTTGPTPSTVVSVKPYSALINMTGNTTQNATVTPTPMPTEIKHTQSSTQHPTPTPPPNQMTPTAMAQWEPMEAWKPMEAMTPAIQIGAMTPWQPMH